MRWMGGSMPPASAVNWAEGLGLFQTFDEISAFARPPAIDRGIAFVPALAGLGCPHWSRPPGGPGLGLSLGDGKADLMQALLEGIALRTAEVLAAMDALHPFQGPVSIDGGLSRNAYFVGLPVRQLRAMTCSCPMRPNRPPQALPAWPPKPLALTLPTPDRDGTWPASPDMRPDRMTRFAAARQAIEAFAAQMTG